MERGWRGLLMGMEEGWKGNEGMEGWRTGGWRGWRRDGGEMGAGGCGVGMEGGNGWKEGVMRAMVG